MAKSVAGETMEMPKIDTSFLGFGNAPTRKRKHRKRKPQVRRHTYSIDRKELLRRQKGKCAYKICPQLNAGRVRQSVTISSNLDHKTSVALWKARGLKGNVNNPRNLQLLCPMCHDYKNKVDSKKLAQYKEAHKKKPKKRRRRKSTNPFDVSHYMP